MKTMVKVWTLVVAASIAAAACGSQKAPAQAALATAQSAFSQVSAEAQKYVPDQAKAVQDALTAAQTSLTNGDYAAALQQAQALPAKISDLTSAIAAKKADLTKAWTDMSGSVPKLVAALKSRADILAQSRHLPAGLTKDAVDNAKSGVAAASQAWADASTAMQSGDLATAAAKASAVKAQVIDLMKSLNMQVPAAQ